MITPIDITYNDEVGFLKDSNENWEDWISKLLLLAKKEIDKDTNLEMSINFVDEERSPESSGSKRNVWHSGQSFGNLWLAIIP